MPFCNTQTTVFSLHNTESHGTAASTCVAFTATNTRSNGLGISAGSTRTGADRSWTHKGNGRTVIFRNRRHEKPSMVVIGYRWSRHRQPMAIVPMAMTEQASSLRAVSFSPRKK
jgi:hypothetical protein